MPISQAFSCLGIPICQDVRMIKKAYQKMLPLHHPEVDPDGFMQLHEAYKLAMNFAQSKIKPSDTSTNSFSWQPDTSCSGRDITGYDELFANLDSNLAVDPVQQNKSFSREILRLKFHWLPIPLKHWCRFFSSKAYLLCRGEAESLTKLFDLLLGKIHSYPVLCYLLERLWELDSWLYSEGYNDLSVKTRNCILELREQYRHYLKLGSRSWISRQLFPIWWYYQALPFYFKLAVSSLLVPVLSFGSGIAMLNILVVFYILEFCIWFMKIYRKIGIYHPSLRYKKGVMTITCRGDSGLLIAVTIFALLGQICAITYFMELFFGSL